MPSAINVCLYVYLSIDRPIYPSVSPYRSNTISVLVVRFLLTPAAKRWRGPKPLETQLKMNPDKFTIRKTDMNGEQQRFVEKCLMKALEKFTSEQDICTFMKTSLDSKYKPTWHCVIGKEFARLVKQGSVYTLVI